MPRCGGPIRISKPAEVWSRSGTPSVRPCTILHSMTKPTAKLRATSVVVATKPGCAPLKEMYAQALAAKPRSWNEAEEGYVAAMQAFDRNAASGLADMADLQNGKGDF